MQKYKKLKARILSLALSVAMVTTMMPATVFAAEGGTAPGASSIGTIQSFDKLGDRFQPSTGEGVSKDVYTLNVELDTLEEDLRLPDELTAMVARTTTVSTPSDAEDEPVVDSGKPSEPAVDEVIPDEDKVVGEDTDDTVSGNQPASPSDAEEEVKEEIPDEDVPLAPEPDEETTVTTVEQESIPVTWNSDKEYVSDENGQFIYTAELTEGYNLADGVKLPQIYVAVGRQVRAGGLAHDISTDSLPLTDSDGCSEATPHVVTGTTTGNRITVDSGTHYVTLDGVSITAAAVGGPFMINAGTINLTLKGTNILTAQDTTQRMFSPGLFVKVGATLTVDGTGSLTATGHKNSESAGGGIGGGIGGPMRDVGTITINGGTVTAIGGYGIGPGVSSFGVGASGALTISGTDTVVMASGIDSRAAVASTVLTLTGMEAKYKVDGAYTGATNVSGDKIYEGAAQTTEVKDVMITAAASAITVTINGATTKSGATLQAVVEANGGATAVTSLKITAGKVTTDDWKYLTNLSKLSNFEIADDSAVTSVADIPYSGSANPIFPTSIVSVTVPQEIAIGESAFTRCTALTSASFPAATTIGNYAFNSCAMLASASFPAAETIGARAFNSCIMLTTLELGATPPTVGSNAFNGGASSRALGYLKADGTALTGTDLTNAQAAYKAVPGTDSNTSDNLWYGWTIETVVGPAITIGTQPTSPAAMTYGSITGSLTVAGTASNSNPVSYQWYKNTTNSATGGTAVSGAITASFTIPTTLDAGTHYYYCVLKATGCPDKASDVATVTVNKANATDTMKIVAATVSKNGATGATATLPTKPAAATYGTITYGGTITCSNATVNGDTLTYTAPASTVGDTGTITIPVTTATNYNDYSIVVTITSTDKKEATITAAVADKTYNGVAVTHPTPTAVEKDTTTPVTLTYSYKWQKSNESGGYTDISGNTAPKDAGSYKLVIDGSNDTHAGTTEIAFTISKATVTITADNKSAYVSDAKPTLTYTAAGLASGDTLATVPTLTYESEPDMSKAGSVKIKAKDAVVPNTDNYESAITYVDGTLTISNKSSGGGSSSSQTIYTSVPPQYNGGTKIIGNVRVPDYTVEGAWKKNANGTWNFSGKDGKAYANSWAPVFNPYAEVTKGQNAFDWFKFDASGNMITGWHTDTDGNTYYLNPNSDNTLGAMKTGWVLIDGKYYYFNEMPDGTRGKLFRNTRTPDGYLVDENGVWDGIKKQ